MADVVIDALTLAPTLPETLFRVPVSLVDAILAQLSAVDLPVRNFLFPTFCAREMTIPAGSLIVARRYMVDHLCICSEGQVTVWGDGVEPVVVEAPYTYHARAGVQRIGYFHAPTTWTTVLPIDPTLPATTDPEEILDRAAYVPDLPSEYVGLGVAELLELVPTEVSKMIQLATVIGSCAPVNLLLGSGEESPS